MNVRLIVGDQFIIFLLMLFLITQMHRDGTTNPAVHWGFGIVLFMFGMSVIEQIAQAFLKVKSAGPAIALLQISVVYRSIGAHLPIPYLGKLYMTELNQLAEAYCLQLKYDEALKCMEKRNAVAKARYGADSPEMAEGLINVSYIYSISDRPELAEQYGEQGMKIFDNTANLTQRQQENLCLTLNNLGIAYANSGKTGPALELLTRAIRMKEKLVGPSDPSYGLSLSNIGYTFLCAKEYVHAEKFLRMANAIPQQEKLVTATMKNNFGDALRGVGKLDEAEKLLVEALTMRKECLPARHPHFGYSYHNLANLYAAKGDRELADSYFKMAIDLRGGNSSGSRIVKETKDDYQKFLNGGKSDVGMAQDEAEQQNSAKSESPSDEEKSSSTIDLSKRAEDILANK